MRLALFIAFIITSFQVIGQAVYPAYATTRNPRNTEGDILVLNDSTYILAYSRFYFGSGDFNAAEIASLKTTDYGATWVDNGVLQTNIGLQTTNSASFLRLNSTDVLLFFLVGNSTTDLKCYVRKSTNNGTSFASAIQVTDSAGYWVMNNARAQLTASGRIVLPFSYSPNISLSFGTSPAQPLKARCIYSDDGGTTWTRSTGWIAAPMRGAMEPGIIELSSNNLLMYIRTQTGNQYYSTSSDNGVNWAAATASTLVSPEAPATLIKNGSTIYAIYNNNYDAGDPVKFGKRVPLTISKSTNNGSTWTVVRNIEDRLTHEFSYISTSIVNGYLLLTYYDNISTSFSLKFRKILLTDL